MTNDEIKEKLNSKKSLDRRRAAKEIGRNNIVELGDDLFKKYLEEINDERTWETQCEMIKSLGIINYKKLTEIIEELIKNPSTGGSIICAAASAYVQLKRKSNDDGKPILELLETDILNIINGALKVLAYDKMKPDKETIEKIIKISWDLNKHKQRIGVEYGTNDSREYVANACAGWDKELTLDFLNHCIETAYNKSHLGKEYKNEQLIKICKNSLKGKYSKADL